MGTTITFRRGENDPTSGSGLTLAEPAFNTTLKTFHIGLGYGVTAAWVGAPISGLSADIAAGITYKISTAAAVKNYIGGLCYGNTGAPTITQYVSSFNGLTGAVGGVCAAQANTFTELQSFNSGVSCDSIINSKFLRVGDFNGVGVIPAYVDINSQQGRISNVINTQNIVQHTTTLITNYVQSDFLSGISASGITTSSLYVYGNAVVQGNMTVSGGVTFTISENVLIEDNIITLNSNVTGSPSENAGIEIERGTSANVQLLWNESSDKWTFTNDGSTYYDLPTSVVTSFNGRTGAVQGVSSAAAGTGISVSGTTGAVTITNIGVQSFNGLTGTVQGVSSWNGQTGAVSFSNYVVSFNGNTGAVQGVSSVNGATGAVTNVAKTNEVTNFSAASNALTITDTTSGDAITINPNTNKIVFYDDDSGNEVQLYVNSFGNQLITFPDSTCTLAGRDISQTFTSNNTFTSLQTFSAGISAAGSTFASTANTLDVIASTEGAGLRIARATSGAGSRIGGIRLGRSTTSSLNTYIEGSSGTLSLYSGVGNTGTLFASFSPTQFTLGTTAASFINLNSPNLISFGDQSAVGNNQVFSISGTARTYTFGDSNGVTAGFVGINRLGLCGDYALEVNSPTGKGLQLIYNDHTGAASNWVNMDVSSGGNYTLRPSGGLATVTGTLNVSAGISAAGGVTFGGTVASDTGYRITSNAINAQTGTTYTFLDSDNGKIVTFSNASAVTVTIPTALPVGFNCTAIQLGAGQVGFTAASGLTMNSYGNQYRLIGQHASASVIEYTTNIVNLSGNLVI